MLRRSTTGSKSTWVPRTWPPNDGSCQRKHRRPPGAGISILSGWAVASVAKPAALRDVGLVSVHRAADTISGFVVTGWSSGPRLAYGDCRREGRWPGCWSETRTDVTL